MAKEILELSPSSESTSSAQPDENDAEISRSDYERWWGRATELRSYIEKVPKRVTDKVSISETKNKLMFAFDQLVSPNSVSEPVPEGDVKRINSWIKNAEGFVGFLLQSYEPASPTTEAPVLVKELDDAEDWHWPWIDGWDDPKKRKKILNPSGKEDSQVKRVLIGGALLGGALYLGKRFMEAD